MCDEGSKYASRHPCGASCRRTVLYGRAQCFSGQERSFQLRRDLPYGFALMRPMASSRVSTEVQDSTCEGPDSQTCHRSGKGQHSQSQLHR